MQAKAALNTIISQSGETKSALATMLGRSPNYVHSLVNKRTDPSVGTLVEVADVCGYDLALIKRDGSDTIIIDPPNHD